MKYLFASIVSLLLAGSAFAQSSPITPGVSWYWQLSGTLKNYPMAKVYDVDAEETTSSRIADLKATGHIVICYFSAGTYENYRKDASQFPKSAIGTKMEGWSDVYVDIRDATVRRIMQARMDMVKAKGCHGFEPDVLDAWDNDSGFPITRQDEVDYIRWLGAEGHSRGLLVALKNNPELAADVVNNTDFVIQEGQLSSRFQVYIKQNKAVLVAKYGQYNESQCATAKRLGYSLAYFNLDLDGKKYKPCPN